MPISIAALALDFCVFFTISAHVPYSFLSSKNMLKEDACKSNTVVWCELYVRTCEELCVQYNDFNCIASNAKKKLGS